MSVVPKIRYRAYRGRSRVLKETGIGASRLAGSAGKIL